MAKAEHNRYDEVELWQSERPVTQLVPNEHGTDSSFTLSPRCASCTERWRSAANGADDRQEKVSSTSPRRKAQGRQVKAGQKLLKPAGKPRRRAKSSSTYRSSVRRPRVPVRARARDAYRHWRSEARRDTSTRVDSTS